MPHVFFIKACFDAVLPYQYNLYTKSGVGCTCPKYLADGLRVAILVKAQYKQIKAKNG